MLKLAAAPLAAIALFSLAPASGAEIVALSYHGGFSFFDSPTVGWEFTTSVPIIVTGLGFVDVGSDGLIDVHPVAIWTVGGQLQGSATVASGTAATLVNGFRFATTSFVLQPGDYVVAADKPTGADPHIGAVPASGITLAPGITFVENRYIFDGSGFSFPTSTFAGQELGYFGANFEFDTIATPEPGTWVLVGMGIGLISLGLLRRRTDGP